MHALPWKSFTWESRTTSHCFIHPHKDCSGKKKLKPANRMIKMCLNAEKGSSKARVYSASVDNKIPLVKMCGITCVHDAIVAAEAGSNFIGMILWPKSKRSVGVDVAKEISKAARDCGTEPVGVFVDEDVNEIQRVCDAANITFAQLHGNGARNALSSLVEYRNIIYVMHADKSGELLTKKPDEECPVLVDWILIDSLRGGSGEKFNWNSLQVPVDSSKNGWLLAGGLNPKNVSEAMSILRPDAVDVSSGICAPDGIRKDPDCIASFMCEVRGKETEVVF